MVGAFEVVGAHLALDHSGKVRRRRAGSRSATISAMTSRIAVASWSGGKDRPGDGVAAHDPHRRGERHPIRIPPVLGGDLAHQRPQRVVDQQMRPDLLGHAVRVLERRTAPGPRWATLSSANVVWISHR